jgi:hypothetical protein
MTGRPDAKPGAESQPVVAEVLAFEALPPAVRGSRRALVR